MSLKAGRVGVNPADVDPVNGHLSPSAVDAYTKKQADDKFLSKSDAASTYLSKTDASSGYVSKTGAAGWVDKGSVTIKDYADETKTIGSVTVYENTALHLAIIKWIGNDTAPSAAHEYQITQADLHLTELPVIESNVVMRLGDNMYIQTNGTLHVKTGTQAWSSATLFIPTKVSS